MTTKNIGEIVEQIKAVLPADQVEFVQDLDTLIKDAPYVAPEAHSSLWRSLEAFIQRHCCHPPGEDWQFKVLAIFSGLSEQASRDHYAST